MTDREGRPLKIGHKVYYTYYDWGLILKGSIIKMTKGTVYLQSENYGIVLKIRGMNTHKRIVIINVN